MSLGEFLTEHATSLTQRITEQFSPLYVPTAEERKALSIPDLKREPFSPQKDAVLALSKAFSIRQAAGIAGEPGIGKTFATLALARYMGLKRILVLCPPHLVEEWKEEAEKSFHNCPAYIIEHIQELEKAVAASRRAQSPLQVFILSHSRAKLRYRWQPAVNLRPWRIEERLATRILCPTCGQDILDDKGAALALSDLENARRKCQACQGALWQPVRESHRIFPLSVYIKKRLKGIFDLLVADELHEYKAQGAAQALALHNLVQACPRTLALTGTLSSGKASDFFHILYRLFPDIRTLYKHDQVLHFVRDYGVLERTTYNKDDGNKPSIDDEEEDGLGSIRKGEKGRVYERPGLSPAIVPLLLDKFVFLRLADIAHTLPQYEEFVHPIPLPEEVSEAYRRLERDAIDWARTHGGAGIAQFLQGLLGYPDQPYKGERLTALVRNPEGDKERVVVATAPAFDPDTLYPKEEVLLDILKKERARGRKVLVFAIHTNTRDIIPRLTGLAEKEGLRLATLRSGGKARGRKRELRRLLSKGADGVICHPGLVQTGLNLTEFPTIIFYQFTYSTFMLRQASRRSFRPSQTQEVEVHFLCYRGTVQEKGLALMARKLRSALMAEGEFVDEGLSAFADDGDITRELTRCLLSGHQVPGLEETFRALKEVENKNSNGSAYIGVPEDSKEPLLDTTLSTPLQTEPSGLTVNKANGADRSTSEAVQGTEIPITPAPPPDPEAWKRLEELRARKKELETVRTGRKISITKTLSGNPGQLSLFEPK